MENSRFTFFENYWEFLKLMGDADVAAMVRAICGYAFDGVEPELEGTCALLWIAIRPNVDASLKAAQSGSSGGRVSQKADSKQCQKNAPKGGSKAPYKGGSKAVQEDVGTVAEAPLGADAASAERGLASERKGIGVGEGEGIGEGVGVGESVAAPPAPALPDAYPDGSAPPRGAVRYPRPDPAQVEAFVAASGCGCAIDGAAFCGWYDDHGWPPVGWQNTALRWAREDRDRRAKGGRRARPETGEVRADERAVAEELAQFRAV